MKMAYPPIESILFARGYAHTSICVGQEKRYPWDWVCRCCRANMFSRGGNPLLERAWHVCVCDLDCVWECLLRSWCSAGVCGGAGVVLCVCVAWCRSARGHAGGKGSGRRLHRRAREPDGRHDPGLAVDDGCGLGASAALCPQRVEGGCPSRAPAPPPRARTVPAFGETLFAREHAMRASLRRCARSRLTRAPSQSAAQVGQGTHQWCERCACPLQSKLAATPAIGPSNPSLRGSPCRPRTRPGSGRAHQHLHEDPCGGRASFPVLAKRPTWRFIVQYFQLRRLLEGSQGRRRRLMVRRCQRRR